MRTFVVTLLFFIQASLSSTYAQAAGEITIRNEADLSIITVTFTANGQSTPIEVIIHISMTWSILA
jgi:hypothetical protein